MDKVKHWIHPCLYISELFKNTSNQQVVSHEELKAILTDFKVSIVDSMKEVALNNTINRPSRPYEAQPGPSGLTSSKPKNNPMSDSDSDMEDELEQFCSDLDNE